MSIGNAFDSYAHPEMDPSSEPKWPKEEWAKSFEKACEWRNPFLRNGILCQLVGSTYVDQEGNIFEKF